MANQPNNNCDLLHQEVVDLPGKQPPSKPDCDEYLQPVRIVSLNCFKCESTFPTQSHLNQHLVQKHKVFEYRCFAPECEYSAGAIAKLVRHQESKHKDLQESGNWACQECPATFDLAWGLADHMEMEHLIGEYQCAWKDCPFAGSSPQTIKDHFAQTHRKVALSQKTPSSFAHSPVKFTINRLHCFLPKCTEFRATETLLQDHLKAAHQIDGPFICIGSLDTDCRASFTTATELSAHRLADHPKVTLWRCPYCGPEIGFSTQAILLEHVTFWHYKGTFGCTQCDCVALYRGKLLEHFNEKHGKSSNSFWSNWTEPGEFFK